MDEYCGGGFRDVFPCKDHIFGRLAADGHQLLRPDSVQTDAVLRRHLRQRQRHLQRHRGRQSEGTVSGDVHALGSLHSTLAVGCTHFRLRRVPLQNAGTARLTG